VRLPADYTKSVFPLDPNRWPRYLLRILVISLWLAVVYLVLSAFARPRAERSFFETQGVLVIAHQGGDGLFPGNTLYAFEEAAKLGVDVLELDIHASKDGQLVVIHDDTVDRTTDGTGKVSELTLEELKGLDAGYDWSPERKGESFPYRNKGITVPTLEEVFQTFPDHRINIEIKQETPSITKPLCDLIQRYDKQEDSLVVSFSDRTVQDFRTICPEVVTAGGPNEVRTFYIFHRLFLGGLYRSASDAFQVPEYNDNLHIVTKRFVADAKRKNIAVHVWTVDETKDMQRMTDLGVNGIMTDRPDRLLELLGR
jgi:glycerophosphoryl diester phosphodiesterase